MIRILGIRYTLRILNTLNLLNFNVSHEILSAAILFKKSANLFIDYFLILSKKN